jgi:thiamine kinase-like enzyme
MLIPKDNFDLFKDENSKHSFLFNISGFNRNLLSVYEINGKRVILKRFQKPIFFRRELFFYDLFQKTDLIKTPKIYSCGMSGLATYVIKSGEQKDVIKAAKEWAKIHSHFLSEGFDENNLMVEHDINEVINYVLGNMEFFGKRTKFIKEFLLEENLAKPGLKTILHGDLQDKNIITSRGKNYYIDFEISGVGHPARDLVSLLIYCPEKRDEIVTTYRENIDFDYNKIENDIKLWSIVRASQLLLILEDREGPREKKRVLGRNLLNAIDIYL